MSDKKYASSTSTRSTGAHDIAELTLDQYDPELVRKTWRKVDLHLMPIAVILYLSAYIDRANIGNAKVLGLAQGLHLTDGQYNWALSIFFIGYVIFETPSNIILKRLSPRWYLPSLTVLWGLICSLTAVVTTSGGLLAARFFLGLIEAGFLPGLVYWLSCWYPRPMQGRRFAVLYSTVSLTGAFGGLLATAIHALDGTHGIAGWRWIFIVEGCITAGLGLLAFLFMTSYPTTASFLTPVERRIIALSNAADRAQQEHEAEAFSGAQIRSAFTDWRVYLWGLVYITTYIPVYSVILSLPSVVAGLGYKGTQATLMACPPYGLGFIIVLLAGWTADRYGKLFWHYTFGVVVTMAALIVLMVVENLVVRYIMFFFVMFMFIPISTCWTWLSSNVAGSNKRAAATGIVFSVGNIGGAVSGQIYRAEWAPRYVQGHAINLGCYVLALVAGSALWYSYKRDNAQRDREHGVKKHADLIGEDLGDLGDRHPSFRYYV
ncbi:MFS general substrate transporter [Obba rivulosa]|uniref:MFS general substrate transporter n=1 Tax=Obba rivulosa TaxID=1052685 RepID=A0A8E2AWQ3_9APHY|nr:MFS general substrate transporter [Obba rivulosa]